MDGWYIGPHGRLFSSDFSSTCLMLSSKETISTSLHFEESGPTLASNAKQMQTLMHEPPASTHPNFVVVVIMHRLSGRSELL